MDSDCLPEQDWLERIMKRFDSANIAGVGGRLSEINQATACDSWRSVHMKQCWESERSMPPFLFGSNTVFRRSPLIRVGLYNANLKNNYEDVDICERLSAAGYSLAYEPEAIVQHLRKDNLFSLLNNFWNWHFIFYRRKGFYDNQENLTLKLKDNFGLANRFLEEDISLHRHKLLYLDFLLAFHHSFKDLEYFMYSDNQKQTDDLILTSWLSVIDLTFSYHFYAPKNKPNSFLPDSCGFIQNLFALNLILGKLLRERFERGEFKKKFYKDLVYSIYKIDDEHLYGLLQNMVELHYDWSDLLEKKHPQLNLLFLKGVYLNFTHWINRLGATIKMIELAAENICT